MTSPSPATPAPSGAFDLHESAKAAVQEAIDTWFVALLVDAKTLASTRHPDAVPGSDSLLVFDAHIDHDSCEHDHWREELLSVTIANRAGTVELAAGDDDWASVVSLWSGIRDALAVAYPVVDNDPGTGLVVDLDGDTIAMWEPYFCPDDHNLPVGIFDLTARFADPFDAILTDADQTFDNAESRMLDLMVAYDVVPPSRAAHDVGQCSASDPDDAADDESDDRDGFGGHGPHA